MAMGTSTYLRTIYLPYFTIYGYFVLDDKICFHFPYNTEHLPSPIFYTGLFSASSFTGRQGIDRIAAAVLARQKLVSGVSEVIALPWRWLHCVIAIHLKSLFLPRPCSFVSIHHSIAIVISSQALTVLCSSVAIVSSSSPQWITTTQTFSPPHRLHLPPPPKTQWW